MLLLMRCQVQSGFGIGSMVLLTDISQVVGARTELRHVARGRVRGEAVGLLAQIERLLKLGGGDAGALLEALRYITDAFHQSRQGRVVRSVARDACREHRGRQAGAVGEQQNALVRQILYFITVKNRKKCKYRLTLKVLNHDAIPQQIGNKTRIK